MAARGRLVSAVRGHLSEDDAGKASIAVTLALLTVLAAVIAGLQGLASIEAARGQRETDRLAIELTGTEGTTLLEAGAAFGTYRRWFEQLERTDWARDLDVADETAARRELLQTLERVDGEIQAWTATQTDLLAPPYFDAADQVSDFAAFQRDRIDEPLARLTEKRDVEAAVASAWDSNASQYVTILTVTAVGLFFLGLGASVAGRARPFLAGAGLLFGLFATGWTASVALQPIHRVPADAIEHVVQGLNAIARVNVVRGPNPVDAAVATSLEGAVDEANAALSSDPGYSSARWLRAEANLTLADALIMSADGPTDRTAELLRAVLDDYRILADERPDDYALWWEYGWAALLNGDYTDSIAATDRGLAILPGSFGMLSNRFLARALAGDTDAGSDIDRAIGALAAGQGASSAALLDTSDWDMGKLAELHPDRAEQLRSMRDRLREVQVALRTTGRSDVASDVPALPGVEVRVIDLGRYARGELTEGGAFSDGASIDATDGVGVRVAVPAATELAGRTLSARLWIDGTQDPAYSRDLTLDGSATNVDLISPYGYAGFDLDPGAYELELYVDASRRHRQAFTVSPRTEVPQYDVTASVFVNQVEAAGFECAPTDSTEPGQTSTLCSGRFGENGSYLAVTTTADDQDRINYLYLEADTYFGEAVEPVARDFFGLVVDLAFPDDIAARAIEWIEIQGTAVNDFEIGGATLRVHGAEVDRRFMDIWSPWPTS
jgi:tetratricopeptide (TPR) repeat protein